MAYGILRIQSYAARLSSPIPDVDILVTGSGFTRHVSTGGTGTAPDITIPTPACEYSLEAENSTVQPYALATVVASKTGYRTVTIEGVQIFPDQVTDAQVEMVTSGGEVQPIANAPVVVPPHALWNGTGGSGPAPEDDCTRPLVLDRVIVPNRITVHLGKPAASAKNVTVGFQEYIANVASSEVYPTWPEQALRANIHAQISLALNRIYTEWYPSKGYSFNITNSTSHDQYFVYGRTIFDVMTRITADIFNTYVRKTGTVNPYYTEYCDGKSVTCPGMKQWGTVTQAESGKNALQILKYYYGNDIEVVRTSNIQSIPESYPGTPLREGSTGTNVFVLQRQLNRITQDYPFFGKLTVDGIFGPAMTATVKRFQKQFGLTQDGVVGRATWYKISYIYVSVKDLAELTSEGETSTGALPDGTWGGTTLRVGSTGASVEQAQFWLSTLSNFYGSIPSVTVDGIFGPATEAAVRAFQRQFGLTADGMIGQATWEALYAQYQSVQSDVSASPNAYPGTALRLGDTGANVRLVQFWLKIARSNYSALPDLAVDGVFGTGTQTAVTRFQRYFGLTADGIVGRATWNKLREVYNDIANKLLSPDQRPGTFPGTLRLGSTGTAVRELQFYLYIMSAYEPSIPRIAIDGTFGTATENAVKAYQRLAGLTVDGVVGRATWNSLYNRASVLRLSGPVTSIIRRDYPGTPLTIGSTGDAVFYYSVLLDRIAYFFYSVQSAGQTDTYDDAMATATRSFQALIQLPQTGIVDEATWFAAEALSLALLAGAEPTGSLAESDDYPGYAAAVGCAGPHVRQVQQWLNGIGSLQCPADFVEETGVFTAAEAARVASFQQMRGLSPSGVVNEQTWYLLRAAGCIGCRTPTTEPAQPAGAEQEA